MAASLSRWVVVFDLDDTLYDEADYVASGIDAVAAELRQLFGTDLRGQLHQARARGESDLWALACTLLKLPTAAKESMLWTYRLHVPRIALRKDAADCIRWLSVQGATLAILSDGRSLTQRKKIAALGLAHLPAFISQECGAEKPSPACFELIGRRWPGCNYAYIADNPHKDFLAPNALGWLTVGLRERRCNVHSQSMTGLPPQAAPAYWINQLQELGELLC